MAEHNVREVELASASSVTSASSRSSVQTERRRSSQTLYPPQKKRHHVPVRGETPAQKFRRRTSGARPSSQRAIKSKLMDTSAFMADYASYIPVDESGDDILDPVAAFRKAEWEKMQTTQEEVLQRLKRSAQLSGVWSRLYRPSQLFSQRPPFEQLLALVNHHFPERSELTVHVTDIGTDNSKVKEHKIIDLENGLWFEKPADAKFRWIHCPLGRGLVHSSIEDLFLHARKEGRHFKIPGRPGWRYLEIDMLQFRSKAELKNMQFIMRHLSNEDHPVYKRIQEENHLESDLRRQAYGENLYNDILWRKWLWGVPSTFWDLVKSDLPWSLTDQALDYRDASGGEVRDYIEHEFPDQVISDYPLFKDAVLVVEPFRMFHSNDGYLLTFSSQSGIDYIEKDFHEQVREPREFRRRNENTSALYHIFTKFSESGTAAWPNESLEWLMVYILSELATTPHDLRAGKETPSILKAYHSIIRNLHRKKTEPWERHRSKDFVNNYVDTINEICSIIDVTNKKITLFEEIEKHLPEFEEDPRAVTSEQDPPQRLLPTSSQRIEWSLRLLREQLRSFKYLEAKARQSLDAFKSVRGIEQNDLAIRTEQQNSALMSIAIVSVVFLPLGFCAAYFGMNLEEIKETKDRLSYFWYVCGLSSFMSSALFYTYISSPVRSWKHQFGS